MIGDWITSFLFHVNRPSHSWDTAFSKFYLENQGSRSWVRSHFKVTMWVLHPIDSHPFRSMSIGLPIPEIQHFQNFTLKIKGQGQMTLMLHNYRSRQFHRTWNGINPSSGFKGMGSAKSGPSAAWFDKFLAHGQNQRSVLRAAWSQLKNDPMNAKNAEIINYGVMCIFN